MSINLLASLEKSIDESEEPAEEESDAEETSEEDNEESDEAGEEEEDSDESEDSESDEEGDDNEEEADDGHEEEDNTPAIDDKAKFKVGDKVLTGKQLREGFMMQADYTRKTQALAEERKQMAAKVGELSEDNDDLQTWVGSLQNVDDMAFELERYFPDTYAALKESIIEETIQEQEMTAAEAAAHRRARKAEFDAKIRNKNDEYSKKKSDKAEAQRSQATLKQTFDGWLGECMKETGLKLDSERHQRLLRNEIATTLKNVNRAWTKDDFIKAAKAVAEELGIKAPPKPKEKAKIPAKKLPPVRSQGHKAPAEKKKEEKAKQKPKHTGDFFENLRRNAGVR